MKRYPVFCLLESIESTVRIKMRVPAGTVIVFPPWAAEEVTLPGDVVKLAEETVAERTLCRSEPQQDRHTNNRNLHFFFSFVDSRLFFDNRQRRSDLKVDDQK